MASNLMLISSAPGTKNFLRAFSLAENIKGNGNSVTLFLIQDGVRAVVDKGASVLNKLISSGVMCYVLEEDLRMRGFKQVRSCQR